MSESDSLGARSLALVAVRIHPVWKVSFSVDGSRDWLD